jgi:hypothetical protein
MTNIEAELGVSLVRCLLGHQSLERYSPHLRPACSAYSMTADHKHMQLMGLLSRTATTSSLLVMSAHTPPAWSWDYAQFLSWTG